jgi:hypothetical protein
MPKHVRYPASKFALRRAQDCQDWCGPKKGGKPRKSGKVWENGRNEGGERREEEERGLGISMDIKTGKTLWV